MNRYQVENKETGAKFTVDYHETVGLPAVEKAGMVLVGWFTDEACTHSFNPATRIDDNTTDLDKTVTENGVKGKLTLYAKWRTKLASYINVEYVADNGTALPDTLNYTDQSLACAKPAPTDVTDAQFLYWVVLDADGNKTNIKVYPGQTFTVDAQYAKRDSENEPYKLTLKAVYNTSTSETTALTYDPNGGAFADGSTDPKTENNLPVNGTVTLPVANDMEDGFLFLGWNHDKTAADDHVVEFQPGQKVGVDKLHVFPNVLYAVWDQIDTDTYVVDYNAKMKLAEEATIATKPAKIENNGTFTVGEEGTAFYQLKQLTSNTKLVNGSVDLSFKGVDFARITGKFYDNTTRATANKVAAKESVTKYVNVVPASSVYFDDDLVNTIVTVGDGSGYNSAVNPTPASAELTKGAYTYKFYGTGIDVYCTTFDDTDTYKVGYAQARIDDGKTPETKVKTIRSQSETERYNVPTFSFKDLAPGVEHTLTLNVYNASHYKLDGIRVYNNAASQELYKDTDEQYAVYVSMRNALINNGEQEDSVKIDDKSGATSGILFVDNRDKMAQTKTVTKVVDGQEVICYEEDGKTPKTVRVYADEFEAYKANSPKTEIYLDYPHAAVEANGDTPAQEEKPGQSITFTLTSEAVKGTKLWIALSAPDADAHGGKVTVTVNGQKYDINVKDAMDMYYPLDLMGATGAPNVMIQNTGSTLISVTNLKITGNQKLYDASVASSATGMSMENSDAVAESFTDVVDMAFEPVTLMTVKLAANNGIDPDAVADPGTPDQPDDPKPGWNDSAYNPMNILKTLFQSLLNGLGNLFKGLGGW